MHFPEGHHDAVNLAPAEIAQFDQLAAEASSDVVLSSEEMLALRALCRQNHSEDPELEAARAAKAAKEAEEARLVAESRQRVAGETYAHSTKRFKKLGKMSLARTLHTPEGQAEQRAAREDWDSAIVEMLQTDVDFRNPDKILLEITRRRRYKKVGGRVLAPDGTDMEMIARDGEQSALMEAKTDEKMVPLAIRAGADRRVARDFTHGLQPGEGFASWTVWPQKEMAKYGKRFYLGQGFREGLSFEQAYLDSEDFLDAFAYSVDFVSHETIREVWAEFGCHIPEDADTNLWLDYRKQFKGTPEEMEAFLERVRTRIYQKAGIKAKRYSMDKFVEDNKEVCDQMYALYRDLGIASVTGELSEFLEIYSRGLLAQPKYLHPGLHVQLVDILERKTLNQNDIERMEELLRYATLEHLRDGLQYLGTERPARVGLIMAPVGIPQLEYMAQSLAEKTLNGFKNKRSYGACMRSSDLYNEDGDDDDLGPEEDPEKRERRKAAKANKKSVQLEACDYQIKCYCCPYDGLGRPLSNPPEKVDARKERSGIAHCLRPGCGAALGGEGKVLFKGFIYSLAVARKVGKATEKHVAKPAGQSAKQVTKREVALAS